MAGIRVVTEPTRRALDVRDVKNFLKLDDDADEIMVRTMMSVASDFVENYTGRSLINRSLELFIDGVFEIDYPLFEGTRTGPDMYFRRRVIELPSSPISSVSSISTFSDDDTETTFSASSYFVDTVTQPARIVLRNGATWPTSLRVANGIKIEYVAGYGPTPATIPEPLRLAMYQYIAYLYEHRGDFERFPPPEMPTSIQALIQPYRILNFSANPFHGKDRM